MAYSCPLRRTPANSPKTRIERPRHRGPCSQIRTRVIDHVRIERREVAESGEYDRERLSIRSGYAIEAIGAQRLVPDTIEARFSVLANAGILRTELQQPFTWLKDKGVAAAGTGGAAKGASC